MHVAIFSYYNLYESKRYFCLRLVEALQRANIEVSLIDLDNLHPSQLEDFTNPQRTAFTCAFNTLLPEENGLYLPDITGIPHIFFLLDPPYAYHRYFNTRKMIITCVDQFDCDYVRAYGFNRVHFFPHAVERELDCVPDQEKPYDVVFLGSCYDHETLQTFWRNNLPAREVQIIESAVDLVLGDNSTSVDQAVVQVLEGMDIPLVNDNGSLVSSFSYYVDNYVRGKDRTELIRSIKHAHVHVFGDLCWRNEKPILGWEYSLRGMKNVTIHPAVPFERSLEILKQSKICLNSMPFFKNGTHERIFTGLACRALPITTDNLWIRSNFEHRKDVLIYPSLGWEQVDGWVEEYLNNRSLREEVIEAGRKKVMAEHTWDVRAQQLMEIIGLYGIH